MTSGYEYQILQRMTQIIAEVSQLILAGTLTEVQGDIRCKVLAALSTVK